MIRKCAWCKKTLGRKPPLSDRRVTHGICGECAEEVMQKREYRLWGIKKLSH